ncbi:MAG: hypothetical protein LLG14_27505 [Nocardiaceae bacterium]|nr:hypothetical protein [Nocardiaceae bacterium]
MNILDRFNASRVRDVVRIPGPAAEALIRVAEMGQRTWKYSDVKKLLDDLDVSEETVAEFREFRE